MLTKDALIAYGADYERGIKLCLGKEDFYFRMISKGLANEKFGDLGKHLEANDIKAAFEDAHALKGITGNLALTPLFMALEAMVEPLRQGKSIDYAPLYATVMAEKQKLDALLA
ncbi:MAG: Hpt domain-containing protein [Treponema sp.]|nr:Hpt domain-containing protein [Treponema sp.]